MVIQDKGSQDNKSRLMFFKMSSVTISNGTLRVNEP